MKKDEVAIPEVGDRLCYRTKVVTDPDASADVPRVVVQPEALETAELRWVHGVCAGVLLRADVVQSICIRTTDGVVHIVGRDDWRFSDL